MAADCTVMNMSGIYESQDFYPETGTCFLDMTDIPGTNCYCDEEAKEEIRRRLEESGALRTQVHFLDSGNYHYLSLFFLEKIQVDFELLLLDNHPDMQSPSFGAITSCGGWVKEALDRLPHLKRVFLYGVEDPLLRECEREEPLDPRITVLRSWRRLGGGEASIEEYRDAPGDFDARRDPWEWVEYRDAEKILGSPYVTDPSEASCLREDRALPIYISLDKDLLRPGEAFCNWSQGVTSAEELFGLLRACDAKREILGLDICGEISVLEQGLGDDIGAQSVNNALNRELTRALSGDAYGSPHRA